MAKSPFGDEEKAFKCAIKTWSRRKSHQLFTHSIHNFCFEGLRGNQICHEFSFEAFLNVVTDFPRVARMSLDYPAIVRCCFAQIKEKKRERNHLRANQSIKPIFAFQAWVWGKKRVAKDKANKTNKNHKMNSRNLPDVSPWVECHPSDNIFVSIRFFVWIFSHRRFGVLSKFVFVYFVGVCEEVEVYGFIRLWGKFEYKTKKEEFCVS